MPYMECLGIVERSKTAGRVEKDHSPQNIAPAVPNGSGFYIAPRVRN